MDFWKNKTVLITGSDGFIGSHLTERLVNLGAKVKAFVYYNSMGSWGWLDYSPKEIKQELEVIPGDIRDFNRVQESVKGCDTVFHLSSLIAIPYSYHAPESYVQTNISGALNVLKACQNHEVSHLLHTSTSEVYGTAIYTPIDEKHPLQGQSPYSASKIGADVIAESFYRSFELPVTTVRPFNTYGPRQSARAVIPTIISQLLSGKTEIQLGALSPLRDFNFVRDTVNGFITIGQDTKAIGEVINIGSGREISIGDLVQLLIKLCGNNAKILCDEDRLRPEKSEVNRLLCSYDKAKELFGYEPQYSLEDGLKETIEWIKENPQFFRTDIYNI